MPLARRCARKLAALAVSLPVLAAGASGALAQGEVNIYSYREPQLIDPLLKAFTDKTGIKANVVYVYASRVLKAVRRGCAEIEEELDDGFDPDLS